MGTIVQVSGGGHSGGISIYPYANYGRLGTKYETLAAQRFASHE